MPRRIEDFPHHMRPALRGLPQFRRQEDIHMTPGTERALQQLPDLARAVQQLAKNIHSDGDLVGAAKAIHAELVRQGDLLEQQSRLLAEIRESIAHIGLGS